MKPFRTAVPVISLLCTLLLVPGCEDPQLAKKESQPSGEKNSETPQPVPDSPKEAQETQKPKPDSQAEGTKQKKPTEAVLDIVEKGETVTVKGSIKSRFEKKDLLHQLEVGLPEMKIVDELESTPNRIAMGWEGRLGDALLVPFFKTVENGELHYDKGIVRLEGRIKREKDFKIIQMRVIEIINGPFSRDIENNLTVEGKKKAPQ